MILFLCTDIDEQDGEVVEMYNEDIKTRFIGDYTTSKSSIQKMQSLFNIIEPFENEYGKDICTLDTDELIELLSKISGVRKKSNATTISMIKTYCRWCLSNNIEGACDAAIHIKDIGLGNIKTQTVANPKHLQKYLDIICEPTSKQTNDDVIRCYYWMAFSGMNEEDILNATISDVNFNRLEIRCPRIDTSYPIYPESLDAFHNCVELQQFFYMHPRYEIWRDRIAGNKLLRGIRSEFSLPAIRADLSKRSRNAISDGKTDLKLSYKRIRMSGLFYRAYQDELAGFPVDFKQFVDFIREGKQYDLKSSRNTQEYKLHVLVKEYEEDYDRWKRAWIYK